MPWKIGLITASRLVLNTARRFAYPFAPVLSRGLGVPLTAITSLIAVNQATTIFGLLIGPITDRLGYRRMMLAGLGVLTLGMTTASFFPVYGAVFLALALAGLGKTMFDPAMQSYISELVPFERRARAMGILEFAWAGSTLIGIPLIAILIDRLGWRAPFFLLSGIGVLSLLTLSLFLPKEPEHARPRQLAWGFWQTFQVLLKNRIALATLGFSFCFSLANETIFVIYGAWLEHTFQVSILTIGISTTVIGIAELTGELLTTMISDKLGVERVILGGLFLCVLSYGLLPWCSHSFSLALGGLFLIFFIVEFTVINFLSLSTELLPGARATMISGLFAAGGLGRITGSLLGGAAWLWGGIAANSTISVITCSLAFGIIAWVIRQWKRTP
ncbi:major facilitator superfamily MFS_1 [Candidatus Vecturithrix granuli]|uniref:Major facilitator superfamily MFS_1 n=1 Tax=Vecturithrix granuli TaxID=1499967 RepID=A0A0S6WAG8_VECG1|nr:major facilitator superfamily MFS_1 [Candidatus Vecturithrix granuli]